MSTEPAQARLFDSIPTAAEQASDDREHELDRTPRGVVRQALARLLDVKLIGLLGCEKAVTVDGRVVWRWGCGQPFRVLDWCAGSGVWASEVRAWCVEHGIPVHITGVELRECERENLGRWCDVVIIGDWTDAFRGQWDEARGEWVPPHFDLALSNPAFSILVSGLPVVLEHASAAVALHTSETPQRTVEGNELAASHPPTRELAIPGSVRFRGNGVNPENGKRWAADSRNYSVSAWHAGHKGDGLGWPREVLPLLPSDARGWVEPPGGERVVLPCWPTRPGWVKP